MDDNPLNISDTMYLQLPFYKIIPGCKKLKLKVERESQALKGFSFACFHSIERLS